MIYSCKNCGYSFFVSRARCPKCGSTEIFTIAENEGRALLCWKLTATPEGFEDSYYLCLININGKANAFCRSNEPLEGEIVEENNGICYRKTAVNN